MFRKLFGKKETPLTGTPAVRRMKTYSAQSGYVYQYYYEGHRGLTFVFNISADRRNWSVTSVAVEEEAIREWEQRNRRELSSTERYAIAKMALFEAFDERATPAEMKGEIGVDRAKVSAIAGTLEL